MQTIIDHFTSLIRQQIQESVWFKTAPANLQRVAVVRILGVETRTRHTFMAGSFDCACIIAECQCGEETARFALNIEPGESIQMIDSVVN